MKKLSTLLIGLALLITGFTLPLVLPTAAAAANEQAVCQGSGGTWKADPNLPGGGECSSTDNRTVLGTIQQVTDVLLFVVGAVSILMIIVGGLRYTTSAGDQAAMTSAKNTILYAVIGIIVSFMAYAIVHFIFTAFNIK